MKFILYIAMLITVLLPTQGLTLYQHYCGGKLIDLAVHQDELDRCCEDSACSGCQDQQTRLHLDEFQASENIIVLQPAFEFINTDPYCVIDDFNQNLLLATLNKPDTPLFYCSGRQRSILHQSFLI